MNNNLTDNTIKQLFEDYQNDLKKEKLFYKNSSNIPIQYWKYTWHDYHPDNMDGTKINDENIINSRKKAFWDCVDYTRNLKKIHKERLGHGLVIKGLSGSGKTVLGTLILRDVIYNLRERVLYENYSKLAMEMLTIHLQEQHDNFLEKYSTPEYLLIDEIESGFTVDKSGNIKTKNSTKIHDCFAELLMSRYLDKKPTIVTTSIFDDDLLEKTIGDVAYKILKRKDTYFEISILGSKTNNKNINILMIDKEFEINLLIDELTKLKSEIKDNDTKYKFNTNTGSYLINSNMLSDIICDVLKKQDKLNKGVKNSGRK
jgi:DNA replication protein DnaC